MFETIRLFRITYPQLFYAVYVREMQKQLSDCATCLDVGCGVASPTRFLNFRYRVGVDGHEPTLERARGYRTHDEYRLCNVQDIGGMFSPRQFECVVALDLIEHLTKEKGIQLLLDMERIASRKILIFTPNGFLPQHGADDDLQTHLSGWDAEEMQKLGYRVIGMHGEKALRGPGHEHRIRPQVFAGALSLASHYLYARSHPRRSAALLCVKDVSNS